MPRGPGNLSLYRALERLLERRPILIGVDFDGTIAPLADHPDLARPDPGGLSALTRLAGKPGLKVVMMTGRALAALREMLGAPLPGVTLIGEHGNDSGGAVGPDHLIEETATLVRQLASSVAGAHYEVKPHSVTFHYRMVDSEQRTEPIARLRSWAQGRPEISLIEGKEVIELSTTTGTKGDAIASLARGANGVFYAGDDVTDETVFRILGPDDVGVKVGEGETAAAFRVADVAAVVELLEGIDLMTD